MEYNVESYIEKYVLLCSKMCKKPDDYLDKKNVKKHNEAMKSLNKLTEELYKNTQLSCEVYYVLLNCEDDYVKMCAAADCLKLEIYVKDALKILKRISRSKDKMASMSAERILLVYKGKLAPDEPF